MLENGITFIADGRQYTVIKHLGTGANTIAYLAECTHGEMVSRCILKEYSPHNREDYESGKSRFINSGKMQNNIRNQTALNNQTPPVCHIFEANGTVYIDVACYNGTTLDKLVDLSLPQYMEICRTIAKAVAYYHNLGYICLDLKPENIFIMQNSPEDTITQLVEFIDFDSIEKNSSSENAVFSYTREWAAPEQLNPCSVGRIGFATDIYTIGEIVFYLLFGRHSSDNEHRGFSKYPFQECKFEFLRFTERPDIQGIFTRIFRNTLRSSVSNRFKDISGVVKLLDELVNALNQKDYVIPVFPSVSPDFVGRDTELKNIASSISCNPILFITGIGGIGKTTIIKNYISKFKTEYDVIVYLEYDGDIIHTFCDDMQLQISTISRQENEQIHDYFNRKLKAFQRICSKKHVLFVLDNYTGRINKDLSRIIDSGYITIIVTRNQPPKNSFTSIEITAINDVPDLFRLITLNLDRPMTKEEKVSFEEIIMLVQGHTLVIELISRQISAGRLDIRTALDLIRQNGFSRFSEEKISNYKDGEEVYDTLSAIVTALFDAGNMSNTARLTLKVLSLLNVRGLEFDLISKFFPDIQKQTITELSSEGWLYSDKRVRIHPVISETICNWVWHIDDIKVMEYHKKMIDIYVGMSNDLQIKIILREAGVFRKQHPRHIITAMYYDMIGCYYDTLIDGNYIPYNNDEKEMLEKLIDVMDSAIVEMEESSDKRKNKYLPEYYLSLASILIRCSPDFHDEAADLLDRVYMFIEGNESQISDNHCYYCMVSAWYYTLAVPDITKTKTLTEQAERIARQVFPTNLELIDIIHIPTANCYFYHNDLHSSAHKIEEALEICNGYPDMLPYIDKKAELLNILLDIYTELQDKVKCLDLIDQIDLINEKYKDQGIHREVDPEIRIFAGS